MAELVRGQELLRAEKEAATAAGNARTEELRAMQEELQATQRLLEKERAAAAEGRTAEEQRAAERAQAEEEARERRVAHIAQTFARRIMRAGLAKGWQTWADQYEEAQYKKRVLAGVVARFSKPKARCHLSNPAR